MSSHKKVILAKLSLNSGCVCVIWWMLLTQEPLGRSWLLSFATVATDSENKLSNSCDIVQFWILLLFFCIDFKGRKRNTMPSLLMVHCACLSYFWVLFPCSLLCSASLCEPCIMRSISLEKNHHWAKSKLESRVFSLVLVCRFMDSQTFGEGRTL